MSVLIKEASAKVKFYNATKGFGFFTVQGQPDAFFHVSWLEEQGFYSADMVQGVAALIDHSVDERGRALASKIHKVGTKVTHRRTIVDRQGELVIVKAVSVRHPGSHFYEIRLSAIDGTLQDNESYSLASARAKIGKVITAPTPLKSGKTNFPGQGPAKGSSASGKNHTKKAA